MSWFCLRMHAPYRCRHAGVCCRADWEIPVENHVVQAIDTTRLRSSAGAVAIMAALEQGIELHVPRRADRACLFFEPDGAGSCAIHREAGEAGLPSACRHFPREVLLDSRGTFVSLSHYCPTAAALLTTPRALDIVEAQPPLRIAGPIDGLDAREALPPLVRPGLLSDREGYAAWEAACLAILAQEELTAAAAVDRIEALTEAVRTWVPGDVPLRAVAVPGSDRGQTRVRPGSDRGQTGTGARSDPGLTPGQRRLANAFGPLVAQHVPEESFPIAEYESRWAPLVEGQPDVELVVKNYLAARLFATWIAYQSQGLRTIVEWLRTCHAVIRNEMALQLMTAPRTATAGDAVAAAGRADLLMVHTVDGQAFADFFRDAEAGAEHPSRGAEATRASDT